MVYVNVTTDFANLLYDDDDELHLSCRKAAIPRLSFRIIRGVVYSVPADRVPVVPLSQYIFYDSFHNIVTIFPNILSWNTFDLHINLMYLSVRQ